MFILFFNVTATTEIYTNLHNLSLRYALPISNHLFHLDGAVVGDRDLGHLGDEAIEGLVHRDAPRAPGRRRLVPARLLRRQPEHAGMARMFGQEIEAERDREIGRAHV